MTELFIGINWKRLYQMDVKRRTTTLIALGASVVLIAELLKKNKKAKRRPEFRVNSYLLERNLKGRFATDFDDMVNFRKAFTENFHMGTEYFNSLYKLLEPHLLPRRNSRPHDAISPKQKLAIVLEYLASGDLQRHTASCYRISKQHFGSIIDQVCDAICAVMKPTMAKLNKKSFVEIANDFNAIWNFPNCIGAIDGKHVAIKAPPKSGSMFFNYKLFHSIVIMAVCDASYRFTYLDIGAYGSEGDANVFSASKFGQDVINDGQDFPPNSTVNGVELPFFYVADDAFPLCKRILKPFTERNKNKNLKEEDIIFNYRLSRARRCIENAFGIMCAKWQCLRRAMLCGPDRAQKITSACCLLHNYCISNRNLNYFPPSYADRLDDQGNFFGGEWRKVISNNKESLYHASIPSWRGRSTDVGKFVREKIKEYVTSPIGAVPWQREAAFIEKSKKSKYTE